MIRKALTVEQAGIEAEIAFDLIAQDVVTRARESNTSIVVWDHEAGKIKHLDPNGIQVSELRQGEQSANG